MATLLQREKAKNEAYLQPLRENAKKLSFLHDTAKSNDGSTAPKPSPLRFHQLTPLLVLPLSEMTDFITDQLRTLISSLRVLRSVPTNVKQGTAEEARKLYLEQLVAKRLGDARTFGSATEGWKEQKERFEKIATLEDLRKIDGKN